MSQQADLKKLAQKAYLSYHQDGLVDLIIGWVALFFGLNMTMDNTSFLFMSWIAFILYMPLKNRITVPRFGYIQFDNQVSRRGKMIVVFLVLGLLLLFVLGIAVFLVSGSPPPAPVRWLRSNTMLFFGVMIAFFFSIAGLISGIQRLFIYAGLSLILMVGGHILKLQEFMPFIVLGCIILSAGAVLLIRFMQKYPLILEEENNDVE